MKRKELWELLGEVPADMIEEASVPRKGNRVLWLRRALPLAAAVLLLCATAVAAGKYFGWQDVLNAGPEQMTDYTEPLAVQVDAGDITFTVTEALADERVLYLLWEMQAPAAIFDERSTVDGRLDFGEASVDTGGGMIFSAQPPKGKSNILCGYLVADWNDAMRGSTAHLRVSGLGGYDGTEWEANFTVPQTVESVTLRDDEQVKITCSPITMAITLKDVYEAKGYEWEIETATGTQTAYEDQRQEGGQVVRVLQLQKPVKPQEVTAVRKEGIDYLHQTDFSTHTLHIQSWLDREVYILPVENGKMSRGVIGVSNDDYTLFEAPAGTLAVAMRDGVVESVGNTISGMGGNQVLIRHEDGSAILYGHLKNVTLKPGDTVKQGEKLGECSDSGNTWAAGVGIVRYEVKNQFGGTAFPTYDRTWTFEEIFADSCQKPVEDAGKITWENSDLEDFCSFTFRMGQKNVNITAMKAGKVIASKSTGTNKGLGRVVAVEHEDGTYALYGYCSKIIAKVGDVVQAGDILAVSGRTGLASGENDSLALVLIEDKDGLEYWIGGGFA